MPTAGYPRTIPGIGKQWNEKGTSGSRHSCRIPGKHGEQVWRGIK